MYITINDVIGEKRIDLSYPIKGRRPERDPAPRKLQSLACLATMFSIGYRGL